MTQNMDVLVIGSGPIGTAAARRLAEGNLRVMMLESGTAITDPAGSHLRNDPQVQSEPDAYFATVERYISAPPELPSAFDVSLVGGQGILWTNNCPRAAAFERCDAMSPDEWDRWYTDAEAVLEVVPEPTSDSKTGRNVRNRLESALPAAGRSIRGLPFAGRELGADKIHYVAPWDIIAAATDEVQQRITLRSATKVTRLLHEGDRIVGVETQGPGDERATLEAPIVIVAGGAVATPKLLHASGIRPSPLGRGYTWHGLLIGQVVLEAELCAAADEDDLAPRQWIPPTPDAPWHIQVLRDTCPLPANQRVDNRHRLLEFQGFVPVEPQDENALVITDDGQGEFRFELSARDRHRMQAMEADVQQLAARLGSWRKGCEPTWMPEGAHLMGTCRMHDPSRGPGVADRTGRVHGFKNLYLGTVGLLPSPVAVNPTLTGVALMLRTCAEIVRGAK